MVNSTDFWSISSMLLCNSNAVRLDTSIFSFINGLEQKLVIRKVTVAEVEFHLQISRQT